MSNVNESKFHEHMGLGGKPYILCDTAEGPYLDVFAWILGSGRCPNRWEIAWRSIWTNSQPRKCHMHQFSTILRKIDFVELAAIFVIFP